MAGHEAVGLDVEEEARGRARPRARRFAATATRRRRVDLDAVEEARVPAQPILGRHRGSRVETPGGDQRLVEPRRDADAILDLGGGRGCALAPARRAPQTASTRPRAPSHRRASATRKSEPATQTTSIPGRRARARGPPRSPRRARRPPPPAAAGRGTPSAASPGVIGGGEVDAGRQRRQRLEDPDAVLVCRDAEHQREAAPGEVVAERGGQRPGARRVVSPVEDERRPPRCAGDHLEAPRPPHARAPGPHGGLGTARPDPSANARAAPTASTALPGWKARAARAGRRRRRSPDPEGAAGGPRGRSRASRPRARGPPRGGARRRPGTAPR